MGVPWASAKGAGPPGTPSSRGLGHRPFKAAPRVRTPLGSPKEIEVVGAKSAAGRQNFPNFSQIKASDSPWCASRVPEAGRLLGRLRRCSGYLAGARFGSVEAGQKRDPGGAGQGRGIKPSLHCRWRARNRPALRLAMGVPTRIAPLQKFGIFFVAG